MVLVLQSSRQSIALSVNQRRNSQIQRLLIILLVRECSSSSICKLYTDALSLQQVNSQPVSWKKTFMELSLSEYRPFIKLDTRTWSNNAKRSFVYTVVKNRYWICRRNDHVHTIHCKPTEQVLCVERWSTFSSYMCVCRPNKNPWADRRQAWWN